MADESLRNYGVAAPHGPTDNTGRHVATQNIGDITAQDMNQNEKDIFNHIILPEDSYDANGTYWADLNIFKRIGFVTSVDKVESAKELRSIGRMIKNDPLSPVAYYFKNMVLPGFGLLLEGYVLFSIGNIEPLFEDGWGTCWKTYKVCNKTWVQSVQYLETIGIICGQIIVGIFGDWFGRRYGLIQDAAVMFIGLLMLTAAWGTTLNGWVICYAWSLFFYSVGVGGEYPMTATSAMENAVGSGRISTRDDRLHRGRKVISAFLMQGWGQFFNQVILILSLLAFHSGRGGPPYSKKVIQWVYRVSFAIPAFFTLWLVYYRTYKMKAASKQLTAAKKKAHVTGYDIESLKLTFTYFGFRLLATCGAWYANDVFFYGNKLFQSQFIAAISPGNKSIMVSWLYNLINIGVELVGYYLSSLLVDNKLLGRKWMMVIGFLGCFICFVIPAFDYNYYAKRHPHKFQTLYFLSSFFNQFGPNTVTFLVAAEVYPTPIRATAHGFSAAWGKLGALTAAILYNYISIPTRFLVVPWFGLAGALLTILFLPDTTGLDLKEQERRWNYIRAGREHEYHGVAVHPKHLSWYERLRGKAKHYDPTLDYAQKVQELRGEWEAAQVRKGEEDVHPDEETQWSNDIDSYFQRTGSNRNEKINGDGSSDDNNVARDIKQG